MQIASQIRQHAQRHGMMHYYCSADAAVILFLQVFKALDFVLVEARRYGLRVILSVLDNWKYSGGIDEFVDWSATSPRRTRERPADKAGDTATHVRRRSMHACIHVMGLSSQICQTRPSREARQCKIEDSDLPLDMLQEYDQETKDYEVERHAVFWSDDGCKSLYKNHLKCVRICLGCSLSACICTITEGDNVTISAGLCC
jgi:hypothetical protein